jgi:iron complex outermembrane receptor protein
MVQRLLLAGVFGALARVTDALGAEPERPRSPTAEVPSEPVKGSDSAEGEARPELVPPRPRTTVDAQSPPGSPALEHDVVVVLLVTIEKDGTPSDIVVSESGGALLDEASMVALRAWTFTPATRDGRPIASRIKVPFRFAAPVAPAAPLTPVAPTVAPPAPPPAAQPGPSSPTKPAALAPKREAPIEVDVRGRRPPESRAPSDFTLDREVLVAAPRRDAADLLSAAPGVYVAKAEGDAVAHEIFLRGFDAAHGQDVELTVDGWLPINQPSHIHGQGYADLNFVIPEVVRSVRVTEGVVDPRQGDFAVAGSVDFALGVTERGYRARTTLGSFGTFRQLVLWAPAGEPEETFAAVAVRRSDGFGSNRGAMSGVAMGQLAFEGPARFRGVAIVSGYGARANLAGIVRRDDVEAGRVGFLDTYRDPSATAQSAFAARALGGVRLERVSGDGARTSLGAWLAFVDYRSRENFTGYLQRSRTNPEWVGRGDLIEQGNQDLGFGARAAHRTRRFAPTSWLSGDLELGLTLAAHRIEQQQNLLQAPQNATWDRRIDASIRAADVGLYADTDWRLSRVARIRAGVRADVLSFDVDDALGNFTPAFQRQNHVPGFRRTALGAAFGPRVTLEGKPLRWLDVVASYGEGYRSPQALQLSEGENAPFTKVRGLEGGVKVHTFDDALSVTAAGYATFLSSDLAFDPEEGALDRVGPTTRRGVVAHVVARPLGWLLGSASITYVHATLDEPPPATAENPSPPFEPGQLLPYVPPVVVRADLGAHHALAHVGGGELEGRLGTGFSFLSSRPLPYGQFADPVALLDASASLRWRWIELALDAFNLADARYAATEYSFVSDWRTSAVPSRLPARHFSAGQPRTFLASLGLGF